MKKKVETLKHSIERFFQRLSLASQKAPRRTVVLFATGALALGIYYARLVALGFTTPVKGKALQMPRPAAPPTIVNDFNEDSLLMGWDRIEEGMQEGMDTVEANIINKIK